MTSDEWPAADLEFRIWNLEFTIPLDAPAKIIPGKPTDPPAQASLLFKAMQSPTPTNKFKTGVRAGGEVIGWQHGDVGGEDRYGRYSTTYRIESPQKVGRVFYPAGHAPAGSDTGLAYAARQLRQDTITATAKDDSPGTCDWDKDGRPNCSVSVNPSSIDLADTGWTEPHVQQTSAERQISEAIKNAKGYLKNNRYCTDFLNKVLQNLRPDHDEINFFALRNDELDEMGRIYGVIINAYDLLELASRASIVETGKSGETRKGATVYTNDLAARPGSIFVNNSFASQKPGAKIFAVIHEGFHQLKGVDDIELARAAQLVDGKAPNKLKQFPDTEDGQKEASLEFNAIVQRQCNGLSASSGVTIRLN